jgi:lipopolysaccharide biosynthesis protein
MIKPIAIHLPQFHPIPENDVWWGKGFTEWSNVTKAKPLFKGHHQPHLPADLGFYDLRLGETREDQARLAQQYGIYGFCYYHYWFNGKRLLNRPLDDMIASKKPDFPFMLCWANENWTRRWDGKDHQILMRQDYNTRDDADHIRFLWERFFSDSRYIRVDNKPFFVVYRPALNPDMPKTLEIWRNTAIKLGFGDLYLGYMYTKEHNIDFTDCGFDCAIEFQPDFRDLTPRITENILNRALHKFRLRRSPYIDNRIFDYQAYARKMMAERKIQPNVYPGITPMWDNAARRKTGATIFKGSSPDVYKEWLSHIVKEYKTVQRDQKFVFLNAWNEWAEGNHLEPCQRWDRQYLEATKQALNN